MKEIVTYLQSISPMSTTISPLPNRYSRLDDTISLFHKTLNSWNSETFIDDFDTISSHELQTNTLKLRTIVRLKNFKDTENYQPIMNLPSDDSDLLVHHDKEHMKFAKVILHVTNSDIVAVRSRCHINEIHLNSLKKTLSFNGFERAFTFAMCFSMTDLTQFDKKEHLQVENIIILITNLVSSDILIDVTETIVDHNNDIPNAILDNDLSSFFEHSIR